MITLRRALKYKVYPRMKERQPPWIMNSRKKEGEMKITPNNSKLIKGLSSSDIIRDPKQRVKTRK